MSDDSKGLPGLSSREDKRMTDPILEDEQVVEQYSSFPDKGPVVGNYRLTILTDILKRRIGELVRIVHICEAVAPGTRLYVMGPKPIHGEYVDHLLATEPEPPDGSSLAPATYDGRVIEGPGVDYNFEITRYRFHKPGTHTVQWRVNDLMSNTLEIEVIP